MTQALNSTARMVAAARDDVQLAIIANHAGRTEIVADALRRADNAVQDAIAHLVTVEGAERPGGTVARDNVPLEKLDTPATRAMLAALDNLVAAAQRVDQERGWVDASGEGIGFAEQYGHERLRIATEIFGPKGKE